MHHPTDRIVHTTAFVTPVVEHWREREIAEHVLFNGYKSTETSSVEVSGVGLQVKL